LKLIAYVFVVGGLCACGGGSSSKAVCGNGKIESGEDCDNGSQNGQPGNGCSADCTFVNLARTSIQVSWKLNGQAAPGFTEESCYTVIDSGYKGWVHLQLMGPVQLSADVKCDPNTKTFVDGSPGPLPAGTYAVTAKLYEKQDAPSTDMRDLTSDVSSMAMVASEQTATAMINFPFTSFLNSYQGTLFFQTFGWAPMGSTGGVTTCTDAMVSQVRFWLRRDGQLVPGQMASCGRGCSFPLDGSAATLCHTPTGISDAYSADVPWGPYELVVGGYGSAGQLLYCSGTQVFVGAKTANPTFMLTTAATTATSCP
jgi:cysteine-rich repeat protein